MDLKIATEKRLAAIQITKQEQAIAKTTNSEHKVARALALKDAKEKQAVAKEQEREAKIAKQQAILADKENAKRLDQMRRSFAGLCAQEISKFILHATQGEQRKQIILKFTQTLKGKVPWKKAQALPEFWDPQDKRGVRCVSVRDMFGKYLDPHPVYASECFSWELWRQKKPSGPSYTQMRKFVDHLLPGYGMTIGPRFPVDELLKDSANNADIAFLTAVWYYSSIVSVQLFPCGLQHWPPNNDHATKNSSGPSSSSGGLLPAAPGIG